MSKTALRCLCALPAILILALAFAHRCAAQTPLPQTAPAQGRFAQAVQAVSKDGAHAKLPPHISTLLGFAKEEEWLALQKIVRTGKMVQGIDVSVANKNDVVLFVVDEAANNQSLYLTSPDGVLRRVVAVKAGVGDAVRINDKVRAAFRRERLFWTGRLAPATASATTAPRSTAPKK